MKVGLHSRFLTGAAFAVAVIGATLAHPATSVANPGSAKQQMACMGDVMRLCFSSIASGDQAIIACMTRNKDNLTKRCKSTLPPI